MTEEKRSLLKLVLTPGLGPKRIQALLQAFGTANQVLAAPATAWADLHGFSPRTSADMLRQAQRNDVKVDEEVDMIVRHDAWLLGIHDEGYPHLLKLIPDPPPLLWGRGQLWSTDAVSVALVGSRRCTAYGREQAQLFGAGLAQQGLTVVSGGAEGIDTAAHYGALQAGGRTIVVLGSGLAKPWPTSNLELFKQVVADHGVHGAVLSECPMQRVAAKENFPRRNRIVSGLSLGVLMIEAARRSGALITARQCVDDHGRELMAVPGRVDSKASQGCHDAIRDGWAGLVTNVSDVLDRLGEVGTTLKHVQQQQDASECFKKNKVDVSYSQIATQILQALDAPRSLDELTHALQLQTAEVLAEVTMLEIRGDIQREGSLLKRRR